MAKTKIMGPQDFSGQEQRDGTSDTPDMEAAETRDVGKRRYQKIPEGTGARVRLLQSDDDRIHEARSEVLKNG